MQLNFIIVSIYELLRWLVGHILNENNLIMIVGNCYPFEIYYHSVFSWRTNKNRPGKPHQLIKMKMK